MACSTNLRMAVIGKIYPAYLPPYSTVYWHYKQWRDAGAVLALITVLHGQVREQVKKKPSGQRC
jgi:hypothetical protein